MSNDPKYFVVSNGDAPDGIFFNLEDAKADESIYIDMFDSKGKWVNAIKFVNGEWTENF